MKFELILVYIALLISSISANGDDPILSLDSRDFSAISPHMFANVTIRTLKLGDLNSINCTPKSVGLTEESFDGLGGVENLVLDCLMFQEDPNLFKNLESVVSISLRRIDFPVFQKFFADFPHLKRLTLSNVNVANISARSFSTISEELEELLISDAMEVIEGKSFGRFKNLGSLVINGGQLHDLQNGLFHGLNQLKRLDLSNNAIQVLSSDTFDSLERLEHLSLDRNRIRSIEAHTFYHLKHLRQLDLGCNDLETVPNSVFVNLGSLEHLSLCCNKIKVVGMDAFPGCPKLRTLDLSDNGIHLIRPAAFRGLSLQYLTLRNNDINVLGFDAFFGLDTGKLDLGGNNITGIEALAFRKLTAGSVSLCYRQSVTPEDRISWGVFDDSIGKILTDCNGVVV